MANIKKNDTVVVLTGKDRGKTGKVLLVFPKEEKIIVEGINFAKKHVRKRREDEQGGIIHKEAAIHFSNLAIFCKGCNRPTKTGFNALKDGTKTRYCKRCKEAF